MWPVLSPYCCDQTRGMPRPSAAKFRTRSLKGRLGPLLGDSESNPIPGWIGGQNRKRMGKVWTCPGPYAQVLVYYIYIIIYIIHSCLPHFSSMCFPTLCNDFFFSGGLENAQYLDLCPSWPSQVLSIAQLQLYTCHITAVLVWSQLHSLPFHFKGHAHRRYPRGTNLTQIGENEGPFC